MFSLIISGGFVVTGALWLFQERVKTDYTRVPAGTLLLLGVNGIVGGFVSFKPFISTVDQGLQLMLIGAMALVGSIFVLAGWRWVHHQQMGYPLGILTGALVMCLAYIANEIVHVSGPPIVSFLIPLFAMLVAVVVGYGFPSQVSTSSHQRSS